MPCAKVKNAPGLDIVCDEGTPQTLVPGSKLSANAVLTSNEDSESTGSVTATLYGRSKAFTRQSYRQTVAAWLSRATIFNLEQQIFQPSERALTGILGSTESKSETALQNRQNPEEELGQLPKYGA
ncbi:uncharacterized protein AB675_10559 [Cyphellophora attinorum]|uniref:Uncharacterized protein n=1 Tax=Cyphellophora attinorum TaxID=1664694 RepID=A0A0N1P0N2_9EURO|nr:uncharacterized protein AB675_10559 [Phialophora attinorum]KPI40744.1 hypothetical protein AB675_10559 [Phialophora attinorum]